MHQVIVWDNQGTRSEVSVPHLAAALTRAKAYRTMDNRTVDDISQRNMRPVHAQHVHNSATCVTQKRSWLFKFMAARAACLVRGSSTSSALSCIMDHG